MGSLAIKGVKSSSALPDWLALESVELASSPELCAGAEVMSV